MQGLWKKTCKQFTTYFIFQCQLSINERFFKMNHHVTFSKWLKWMIEVITSWIASQSPASKMRLQTIEINLDNICLGICSICQLPAKDICWAMSQQSIRVWLQIDSEAACVCVRQTPQLQKGIIHLKLLQARWNNSDIITIMWANTTAAKGNHSPSISWTKIIASTLK